MDIDLSRDVTGGKNTGNRKGIKSLEALLIY